MMQLSKQPKYIQSMIKRFPNISKETLESIKSDIKAVYACDRSAGEKITKRIIPNGEARLEPRNPYHLSFFRWRETKERMYYWDKVFVKVFGRGYD